MINSSITPPLTFRGPTRPFTAGQYGAQTFDTSQIFLYGMFIVGVLFGTRQLDTFHNILEWKYKTS